MPRSENTVKTNFFSSHAMAFIRQYVTDPLTGRKTETAPLSEHNTNMGATPAQIDMTVLTSSPVARISGDIRVPGDKSISHRSLMIGAVAVGETVIEGLLEGEDVLRTAETLSAMGIESSRDSGGAWHVYGAGVGGLAPPETILDLGNAGTGARLLMGLIATHDITAQLTGDASLRRRPMGRIATPVEQMGAQVIATEGDRMPLTIIGAKEPVPIEYILPVPSAQVKSAVLLAGLNTPGITRVIEDRPSRDHTELMLRNFGADIRVEELPNGGRRISLVGQPELTAQTVIVPGDPSSAAFPAVAALIAPEADLTIQNVGMNPLRAGLFTTLAEMGGNIEFENARTEAGEPVADLKIGAGGLKGVTVPADRAPAMIDEYPILAVAAAYAEGATRMEGLSELRVKESDRLAAISEGLTGCGVTVTIEGDDLIVEGKGGKIPGGGTAKTDMDHRIAMAFLVAGIGAEKPVSIDDDSAIGTSFPGFAPLMAEIGAEIS